MIAEFLRAQATAPPRSAVRRLFGASPLSDDSRPWHLGALGELAVAQRLATLDPAWTVLHAVPIGTRGSDIDHVVAGPAGVFTINAKFHERATVWVGARRLLVNGQKTDHLRYARYEATRVARMLAQRTGASVPTRAVIVLVNPRRLTIRQQPEDVTVLTSVQLTRWLGNAPGSSTIRQPQRSPPRSPTPRSGPPRHPPSTCPPSPRCDAASRPPDAPASGGLSPRDAGAVRRLPGDADGRMEHPDPMIHAPALTA
ncbi:NERD domain-containing protein [Microbacterium keratanolyticum]